MKLSACCFRLFMVILLAGAVTGLPEECVRVFCPANVVLECQGPEGTPFAYSVQAETSCGKEVTVLCDPPSGSRFPLGTTRVTCVAVDDTGQSNSCTFSVMVQDTTAPEIQCPREIRTPCQEPGGATVEFPVGASDVCDTKVDVTCTPPSGGFFPTGTNLVLCTAVDAAGNSTACTFPVIVTGDCAGDPCVSIKCPSNIMARCMGLEGTPVEFVVGASNECGRDVFLTCDPPSGSLFPVGLTTVFCVATNRLGNQAQCAFLVEVIDDTPPVLNCPSNLTVTAQAVGGAVVTWSVTVTDDCDPDVTVVSEPPSGSPFPIGTSTVRCRAIDSSGNQSLGGFLVTVEEVRPLSIEHRVPKEVVIRWNVPGTLESASTLVRPITWKPVEGNITTNRDERELIYPLQGAAQFFQLRAAPLAPPPDRDGDGVPDERDRCPGTPRGWPVDSHGCSNLQLAVEPDWVAANGLQRLQDLVERMSSFGMLTDTVKQVEHELAEMEAALALIRSGDIAGESPPGGEKRFATALVALRSSLSGLEEDIAAMRTALTANPPNTEGVGDITPADAQVIVLQALAREYQGAIDELAEAGMALSRLGDGSLGTITVRGHLEAIHNAEHWIALEGGQRIGLFAKHYDVNLHEGALVEVTIHNFADGTAMADSIQKIPFSQALEFIPPLRCLYLRVAPVQRFPPFFPGPYLLHYPEAYEHDGTLWLEPGMRLAVVSGGCPVSLAGQGTVTVYRMNLELYYRPAGGSYTTVTLATGLSPYSDPVPLPEHIDYNSEAILTATVYRQSCPALGLPQSCSEPEELSVDAYSVRFRPRYFYGSVAYQQTVFTLPDIPFFDEEFQSTRVTNVEHSSILDDASSFSFLGEAFGAFGPVSSFPSLSFIGEYQLFAVYNLDPYNLDAFVFKERFLGVDRPSAMYWPRLTGYHQGRPFWYTCEVPAITRDAVSLCADAPPTFYRLPFRGGWPTWTISQANFGTFTHTGSQGFAYDFPAASGTQIRAARGGEVMDLRESFSTSNWDAASQQCTAFNHNYIMIRHQDETIGMYVHMPLNGVQVVVGQKIWRGDILGVVGNTGCSTGPHLHFDARESSGASTIPSRFERINACLAEPSPYWIPCLPIFECNVPDTGDILFSTNKGWWE